MADDNVLDSRPQGMIAVIFSPPWWVEIAGAQDGSIVQLHHPQHGWLSFLFPPEYAKRLGLALVNQAELVDHFNGTLPPPTLTKN